jgi:hypothetical protein
MNLKYIITIGVWMLILFAFAEFGYKAYKKIRGKSVLIKALGKKKPKVRVRKGA